MLNWIFKKRSTLELRPAPAPTPAVAAAAQAQAEADKAISRARQAEAAQAEWAPRVEAARGDDAALLRVAQDTPVLDLKLAAVQALASEAVLKQAERAFRDHDRRVHRLAKQRWEAAVAQREARERAQVLIDSAGALGAEMPIPVNRLVSLDRDWAALPAAHLEAAQVDAFTQQRQRLDALMREHDERLADAQRQAAAAAAQAQAEAAAALEAQRAEQARLAEEAATAQAQRQADQQRDAAARAQAQTEAAAEQAAKKKAKTAGAEQLAPLIQAVTDGEAALAEGELSVMETHIDAADAVVQALKAQGLQWPDKLRHRLQDLHAERGRLNGWRRWGGARAREDLVAEAEALARQVPGAPEAVAPEAVAVEPAAAGTAAPTADPDATQPAAPAVADGAPAADAEAAEEPPAGDPAAETGPAQAEAPAEPAAAADVAADAAANAAAEVAGDAAADAADAAAARPAPRAPRGPRAPRTPKLNLKTHADAIQNLRNRWKELDRVGAAASGALWQRFDSALKHAYQPVGALMAAQKAARQDNLAARLALLATLDDVAVPGAGAGEEGAAGWKAVVHALDRFHLAWRQLGPVAHTVPAAELDQLQQRQRQALGRLEDPLAAARRQAEAQREDLVAQALALVPADESQPPAFDAPRRVRDLQAQWQVQARSLTLARNTERALWDRFRAATNAVFERREAAVKTRDAEFAANLVLREGLIQALVEVPADLPEAELKRVLAEHDQQWRQAPEVLRVQMPKLEARWLAAREQAAQALAHSGQRRWLAHCSALAARLALCREREAGAADADALAARWNEAPETAPHWQKALAPRWQQPVAAGPLASDAVEALLLQLEASLDLPATPEQQAARRQLKLQAMKQALEGRGGAAAPKAPHDAFAALLRQGRLAEPQAQRLDVLVAGLPSATPGTFV